MNRLVFKIASVLLQYPDDRLTSASGELMAACSKLEPGIGRDSIEHFLDWYGATSRTDLQEAYVSCVDFNKRAAFNMSFHAYGDRRERGMAMVELKRRYLKAGFPLAEGELPDFLPAMLEFAAIAPEPLGEELLIEYQPAIELVRTALAEEHSPYALILDAVSDTLPELSAEHWALIKQMAWDGPPTEMVGLDPFGPEMGGCDQFAAPETLVAGGTR